MLADLVHTLTVGSVLKTLLFLQKGQAFVELDTAESAVEVVQTCHACPVQLGGSQVIFQFSRRTEINPNLGQVCTPNNPNPGVVSVPMGPLLDTDGIGGHVAVSAGTVNSSS